MQKSDVFITLEFTPNPNTLKYSTNQKLIEKGAINFTDPKDAEDRSPLASALFQIDGVTGIMIGKDFITLTKDPSGDWSQVHQNASSLIQRYLEEEKKVLHDDVVIDSTPSPSGGEVERKIVEILENEIRPSVAMDGGDITFEKYVDGVVYVYLKGSCAGCPSSEMTLKMGIENRLREEIPELKEVVAV